MIDPTLLTERFLSYVTIDTQSDASSITTPSTEKQWVLARKLVQELRDLGLSEVDLDDNGYVMATIPSNVGHETPVIGFIAHYDTTPDFTGTHVRPQLIVGYDGGDIVLNEERDIVLRPSEFEDLLDYKGQTLITTDGNTLLGADDKAGLTEIMEATKYLMAYPEITHGTIKIGFTPDEEIGRGAHKFNVKKFGAQWAYTMDGSQLGELEFENFNAAEAVVTIKGKSVHPGYAKGKMVNSLYIAQDFISSLPRLETPEHTSGREGFFHLNNVSGDVEQTTLHYIIRDHDSTHFEARKEFMQKLSEELNSQYEQELISIAIKDQYLNMREKIEPVMHIVQIAKRAMIAVGVTPIIKPIRGGTDGSQLSFMGLPCPNIFAGGHNFHGRYEYVPVESMVKATEVIIKICELVAQEKAD